MRLGISQPIYTLAVDPAVHYVVADTLEKRPKYVVEL